MSDSLIIADVDGGLLWACVDPSTRFTSPAVAHGKLGASLHPFHNKIEAAAALRAAGGRDVREWKREATRRAAVERSAPKRQGRGK